MPRRKKVEEDQQPSSSKKVKDADDAEPPQKRRRGKTDASTKNKKIEQDQQPSSSKKIKNAEPPPKKTRGKTKNDVVKISEDDENVDPPKKTRGKTKNDVVKISEDDENVDPPKKTRGKTKNDIVKISEDDENVDPPKKTRGKTKNDVVKISEDDENVDPPKKTRGKTKNDVVKISEDDENVDPPKKTRGKTKNDVVKNKKYEDDENVDPNENQMKDVKKHELKLNPVKNFVQFYEIFRTGRSSINQLRNYVVDPVMTHVKAFQWYKGECCFDNRVTFLEWHHSNPSLIAVASKNGDIILWDYNKAVESSKMIKGDGPGYSIQAMKFHPLDSDSIYTVSISGKFLKDNFQTNKKTLILDTGEWMKKWFCSCDINFGGKVMVVGDNDGYATLLTTEGKIIREFKAAKAGSKINSCEFSKAAPWLLVTSTGDKSVKLWDIRKLDNEVKPLQELKQERSINSAYFSLTDGARLLTTDQYDKITVYKGPTWHEETVIRHPHRHFQHLTPIRAYWHPLEDVIVCGRYPNNRDIIVEGDAAGKTGIRTIDFFDAKNGKLLLQHHYAGFNHIVSLSKFNNIGDTLACGAGRYIVIWKPNYKEQEDLDKKFFGRSNKRGDDDDDDDDDKKPPKDNKINKTKLFERGAKKEAKKINVHWKNEK